jgi:hypothetical protein
LLFDIPPLPLPSIFRIIALSRNCPQNPQDKGLRGQNLENKEVSWGIDDPVSPLRERSGLDHDRASDMAGARSDVTMRCGFLVEGAAIPSHSIAVTRGTKLLITKVAKNIRRVREEEACDSKYKSDLFVAFPL